jgi:hypothetical protein
MFAKIAAIVSKPPTVLRPSAVSAGVDPTRSSFELRGCNLASSTKKRAKAGWSKKGRVHTEITCIPSGNKAKCNHCDITLSTFDITGVKEHLQNVKVCCYLISPQAA